MNMLFEVIYVTETAEPCKDKRLSVINKNSLVNQVYDSILNIIKTPAFQFPINII